MRFVREREGSSTPSTPGAARISLASRPLHHAPTPTLNPLLHPPPPSTLSLGYKVALIDADIGLRNLDLLLGLENRVLYTAIDILDGECRLDQALIRDKRWKNLSMLSVSRNRQR